RRASPVEALGVLAPAPGKEEAGRALVEEQVDVELQRVEVGVLVVREGGEAERARAAKRLVGGCHVPVSFRWSRVVAGSCLASALGLVPSMARGDRRGHQGLGSPRLPALAGPGLEWPA